VTKKEIALIGALHLLEQTAKMVREAIEAGQQVDGGISTTHADNWIDGANYPEPDGGARIDITIHPKVIG
jgi:hypothetical protein